VDEPVPEVVLAQVLERPRGEVERALAELSASYDEQGRGFDLRNVAGGWRFYTREECAPVVERFVRDGQEVRLTQAALETLAVVAYRQPVSRGRVSAVRGVNCDGVMRTLTLRGLVEESGTEHETGAILYRTTGYFLERLGLASLADMPALAPFLPEDIEEAEGGAVADLAAAAAPATASGPAGDATAGELTEAAEPTVMGEPEQAADTAEVGDGAEVSGTADASGTAEGEEGSEGAPDGEGDGSRA
jgi:segregation and condensation protein B